MALSAGALDFEQSAALAIGAAIGTTVKAGLVSIGATIQVKRTALALIAFSLTTGILAFLLMPLLLGIIYFAQREWGLEEGAVSLAVFHSMFIAMGVALFLPFVNAYSAFIERILPDRGTGFTRYLDQSLLCLPCVALEAVGRSLRECRAVLANTTAARIQGKADGDTIAQTTGSVNLALPEMRAYLSAIAMEGEDRVSDTRRISDIHIMDHLQRLTVVLEMKDVHPGSARLANLEQRLAEVLEKIGDPTAPPTPEMATLADEIAAFYRVQRRTILEKAALAGSDPAELLEELDTLQWLNRVAHHFRRIEFHLAVCSGDERPRMDDEMAFAEFKGDNG
jgi:phosphate:Na+ symporter